MEGDDKVESATKTADGTKGNADVDIAKQGTPLLAAITDNVPSQAREKTSSTQADGINSDPEVEPVAADEEKLSKIETVEASDSSQMWGWTSWGNMLAVVQDAATEAAAVAKGVVDSLDAETRAIEEKETHEASTSDTDGPPAKDKSSLDNHVEGMISREAVGTALGNAWKGSMSFVKSFEQHVETLAHTIQDGNLTSKAQELLEYVQKETIDIIVQETGIELEEDEAPVKEEAEEESGEYVEEVSFDRCYYIYGGPEYLEELEALADHNMLLCNRARAKLSPEQRSTYDESLKNLQDTFSSRREDGSGSDGGGGHEGDNNLLPEAYAEVSGMQEAGITTAVDMAKGAATGLSKLLPAAAVERTEQQLESLLSLKTEGVHRISELCALSTSHLLQVAKDILASSKHSSTEVLEGSEGNKDEASVEEGKKEASSSSWPESCEDKASLIRDRADALIAKQKKVIAAFTKGLGDILEAFKLVLKEGSDVEKAGEASASASEVLEKSFQSTITELESDGTVANDKLIEALQHLVFVVLVTSV